jgi:hypothetical protein
MNSPNATPTSGESDTSDSSDSDSTDSTRNNGHIPSKKIDNASISFILNRDMEARQQAVAQAQREAAESSAAETDDDDDDDEEEGSEGKTKASSKSAQFRRSKPLNRFYKRLVQKQNVVPAATAVAAEAATDSPAQAAESTPEPANTPPIAEASVAPTTENQAELPPELAIEHAAESEPSSEALATTEPLTVAENEPSTEAEPDPANLAVPPTSPNLPPATPNIIPPAGANLPPTPPGNIPPNQPPLPPRPPIGGFAGGLGGNLPPPLNPAMFAGNMAPLPVPNPNLAPPVVMPDRTGAGLAVLAFFGERFLRKRDTKKLRQDRDKLSKQIQLTQEQVVANRSRQVRQETTTSQIAQEQTQRYNRIERTTTVVAPIIEQTSGQPVYENASFQQTNSSETFITAAAAAAATAEKPVKLASETAVVAAAASPEKPGKVSPEKPGKVSSETVVNQYDNRTFIEAQKREEERQAVKARAEQVRLVNEANGEAVDAEPVKEIVFDRRHEVKDDAGIVAPTGVQVGTPTRPSVITPTMQSTSTDSSVVPQTNSSLMPVSSQTKSSDEVYRQSIQSGFMVGVVVIVLAVIAYFILA